MKFGIVGGLGPASTVNYYEGIVRSYLESTGTYPRFIIESIDMNEMMGCFERSDDNGVIDLMVNAICDLERAGATHAAIACNTVHIFFEQIRKRSPLPLISIVEVTCDQIEQAGYRNVLTLGTELTLNSRLYENALSERGIGTRPLSQEDSDRSFALFFPNLENGLIIPEDKAAFIELTERHITKHSVDAVILGCTEIPLMIRPGDLSVPTIDTAEMHIQSITDRMTGKHPSTETS
ncbi:MAG: amino acid racemase [Clostridiales bacterium]|nr:amino acid racemase [Clostridiales bacterium]